MIDVRHEPSSCVALLRRPSASGFTLVELLAASMIGAMLLIGIHAFFETASRVVRRIETDSREYDVITRLQDHLSETLSRLVVLPGRPAIRGRRADDGTFLLECTVSSVSSDYPLERREYRFSTSDDGPTAGTSVELRRARLAGNHNIEPAGDEGTETLAWEKVRSAVISRGAKVTFSFHTPERGWQESYEGSLGNVGIQVTVTFGKHTLTRRVHPPVNNTLVPD